MRSLNRWIGLLVWGAALLVIAYTVRAAWPERHSVRAYVVLLGDSQGVEPTTEVAWQGVAVGDVLSVRLYPDVDEDLRQRVRAFILSLPREEGKSWIPDRAIVVETLLDTSKLSLDRPLFADVVHSKFTGRAQIDILIRASAPVPAETKGPFLLGPFAEPSNMVENVETTFKGVLALAETVDQWWVEGDGRGQLDRMGDGVARLAERMKGYEEAMVPADGEGPIDRLNRGLRAFADRLPSRSGPPDMADLIPGVRTFREKTLPDLVRSLEEMRENAHEGWDKLVDGAWKSATSLRSSLDGLLDSLAGTERGLREQLRGIEESRGGMIDDLLGGEGK